MAVTPGLLNPDVYRRSDWALEFVLQANGSAVNLTNSTFTAQAWNENRTKKYCDMSCTISDAANGKVQVSMTETQTITLPDVAYWDLKRTSGTTTEYWLTGKLNVFQGYTS